MQRIAITGGMGSGKTHVCRLLEKRGIKVYDCDAAAKRLMNSSVTLQHALSAAVGEDVFPDGVMDKKKLAAFIVRSEENAQKIDSIVHPAVAEDFCASQMEWLESAILFESGFNARVPFIYIICVKASLETRIRRIMHRDGISREQALAWIDRQMPQEEKLRMSDFIISNDDEDDVEIQIDRIIKSINNKQ